MQGRTFGGWASQGYIAGTLCGWALHKVGHCRDTLRLAAGTFRAWALQGHSALGQCRVGHYRDVLWLGAAETLCGWALL